MEMFDLWMVLQKEMDELRSALEESGGLCVMMTGIIETPVLYADNWDSQKVTNIMIRVLLWYVNSLDICSGWIGYFLNHYVVSDPLMYTQAGHNLLLTNQ